MLVAYPAETGFGGSGMQYMAPAEAASAVPGFGQWLQVGQDVLSGVTDITAVLGGKYKSQAEMAKAQAESAAYQLELAKLSTQGQGLSATSLLLLAGLGIGAVMLFKR